MTASALISLTVALKGLAMADWSHPEDLQTLGVAWYYGWSEDCPPADSSCVNMVRSMQLPRECYPVLLVGNEPNLYEPYGAPVSPHDAAQRVVAIEAVCPETKLVVGNVAVLGHRLAGWNWLREFLGEYQQLTGRAFRQALGVHCYHELWNYCIAYLKVFRKVYSGEMWVTEFGLTTQDPVGLRRLLEFVARNFARYAIYTNRQPAQGYRDGWAVAGVDLITPDGWPTENGAAYASFP